MRRDLAMDDLGDLAELPLLAVLATYRPEGTVLLSPVWHEWRDGGFHVVTSSRGGKAEHLRRDPRASIVVCEHSLPYRGVEVRGSAQLLTAGVHDAVQRIASRYLGHQAGAAYADSAADDLLIRLEPGDLRAWDFAGELS
jgi:PPOX class probable F420-dependent enzyme